MKRIISWALLLLLVATLGWGAGMIFGSGSFPLFAEPENSVTAAPPAQDDDLSTLDLTGDDTVQVRPAESVVGQVSASGNIALVTERAVVLEVEGIIAEVAVQVGDIVQAGDTLIALDTAELERTLRRTELAVESDKTQLDKLLAATDEADLAVARANLKSAQENLADVQAGPSAEELAAARSNLASAWARYNDFANGPSDAELVQLQANLKKAEVARAEAQRAYDEIKWRNDVGITPQAAELQRATIDYESAKGAFEETTTISQTDLQSALSTAQDGEQRLNDLLNKPTEAEIANAEAQVASAQSELDELLGGPVAEDVRAAEIAIEQALIDLEEAHTRLAKATVRAPIDGTVLAISVEEGERGSAGQTVVTLADTSGLELTIDVAEIDIPRLRTNQRANIVIDALPNALFAGEVTRIAPVSSGQQGVVYYPVTVHLTDANLEEVRPGMTAVATILDTEAQNGWLVPTSSIQEQNGQDVIIVIRNGQPTKISVTQRGAQGEWAIVEAPGLQAGDDVIGNVTSYIGTDQGGFGPGGGGPPRGPDGG